MHMEQTAANKIMGTARVFLIRHGETEWSKDGKHTAKTEVPLTRSGEIQAEKARDTFVGPGKLINPEQIARVYTSPRGRARKTCEIVLGSHNKLIWQKEPSTVVSSSQQPPCQTTKQEIVVEVTDWLKEWDYGNYEGLTIDEVRDIRHRGGFNEDRNWNIWIDGCQDGESPNQVAGRVDSLISTLKCQLKTACEKVSKTDINGQRKNIVCFAHGHILAAVAARWCNQPFKTGLRMLLDTGGVAVLCFEHDDINEPGVLLGRRPDM